MEPKVVWELTPDRRLHIFYAVLSFLAIIAVGLAFKYVDLSVSNRRYQRDITVLICTLLFALGAMIRNIICATSEEPLIKIENDFVYLLTQGVGRFPLSNFKKVIVREEWVSRRGLFGKKMETTLLFEIDGSNSTNGEVWVNIGTHNPISVAKDLSQTLNIPYEYKTTNGPN